jgi:hypothetical protein
VKHRLSASASHRLTGEAGALQQRGVACQFKFMWIGLDIVLRYREAMLVPNASIGMAWRK